MKNHNHKAVWTLILGNQIFGFVWYSPFLFLTPYLHGRGITLEQMNSSLENMNNDATPFIYGIIGNVLACYFVSWLVHKMEIIGFFRGLMLGVFLSAGLIFNAIAPHYKFLAIKDSVLWIDMGMTFLLTTLNCAILATWKKKAGSVLSQEP